MVEVTHGTLDEKMAYYGNATRPGAHFPLNFELHSRIKNGSNANNFKDAIEIWMSHTPSRQWNNWVVSAYVCESVICCPHISP